MPVKKSAPFSLRETSPLISSQKVILVLTCLFLAGAAVGAMIDHLLQNHPAGLFLDRSKDVPALTARIEQKLNADYHLTPDQQAAVAPLVHNMAQHLHDLRHHFGDDVLTVLAQDHALIAARLDPEQRAAYELANQRRMQRLRDFFLDHPSSSPVTARSSNP